jgi:hypothetical protein
MLPPPLIGERRGGAGGTGARNIEMTGPATLNLRARPGKNQKQKTKTQSTRHGRRPASPLPHPPHHHRSSMASSTAIPVCRAAGARHTQTAVTDGRREETGVVETEAGGESDEQACSVSRGGHSSPMPLTSTSGSSGSPSPSWSLMSHAKASCASGGKS